MQNLTKKIYVNRYPYDIPSKIFNRCFISSEFTIRASNDEFKIGHVLWHVIHILEHMYDIGETIPREHLVRFMSQADILVPINEPECISIIAEFTNKYIHMPWNMTGNTNNIYRYFIRDQGQN